MSKSPILRGHMIQSSRMKLREKETAMGWVTTFQEISKLQAITTSQQTKTSPILYVVLRLPLQHFNH